MSAERSIGCWGSLAHLSAALLLLSMGNPMFPEEALWRIFRPRSATRIPFRGARPARWAWISHPAHSFDQSGSGAPGVSMYAGACQGRYRPCARLSSSTARRTVGCDYRQCTVVQYWKLGDAVFLSMVEQETWAGGQGPGQVARACQADLSCHGWCGLQQCAVEKIQLLFAACFGIGQ